MAKTNTPAETATTAESTPEPQTSKRVVAAFTGHAGTTRIITKEDQNFLIGVDIAKEDLIWPAGSNKKIDITDTDEAVQEYLRKDPEFTVRTVDVPVAPAE